MTGWLAGALVVVGAGALWFLLPHALRRLAERRLSARCRAARAVVLSYDDGPGEALTPVLLDLLAREQVQASFFVLGRNAARSPDLVRRALADGHEVGSHTEDHSNAWTTGPRRWATDLARGVRTVRTLGGCGGLVRPPRGKLTLGGWVQGALRGLDWAWWTVDSRDSWRPRPVGEVLDEVARRGGGVVLMHDFDGAPPPVGRDAHAERCLALTRGLIEFARTGGYRLVRLGDLQGPGAPKGAAPLPGTMRSVSS